jgi:hypothetical protein
MVSAGEFWPSQLELSRDLKYMARARIPEFESDMPSHAVRLRRIHRVVHGFRSASFLPHQPRRLSAEIANIGDVNVPTSSPVVFANLVSTHQEQSQKPSCERAMRLPTEAASIVRLPVR